MPSAANRPSGNQSHLRWTAILPFSHPAPMLAVIALAHAPALKAGFVYDDRNDIVLNASARAETFFERLPVMVRPLLKASYALQDALGGMDAAAFHAVNLGLHLATTFLLLMLLRRALALTGVDRAVATVAVLLWALHPALTETVSYASGRSMGLSTLLLITALLAATGPTPRPILAGLCALLAPLARETALVAPLLLLAWQITITRGDAPRRAFLRAAPVWIGTLLAALIIATMARHRDLVAFSLDQRGPIDSLRANLFAIPEILRLWIAPWELSILPAQPVIYGWTDGPTLLRLACLIALPAVALTLRRRAPVEALAILWTLLVLIPTNTILWRVDPVAIRPLYLAGIGLSLLISLALARLPFGLWLAVALAAPLGAMTFTRAMLYRDEVALFADAAQKTPLEPRAYRMLGLALANAGRVAEAREALDKALRLDPFDTEARNAIGLLDISGAIYSIPAP